MSRFIYLSVLLSFVMSCWVVKPAEAEGVCEPYFEKIRSNEIVLNELIADQFDVDDPVEMEFFIEARRPTDIETRNNSARVSGDLEIGLDIGHGLKGKVDCWLPLKFRQVMLSAFDLRPLNFISFKETPVWVHLKEDDWAVFHLSFSGETSQKFDVRAFPFDEQRLSLEFEIYTSDKGYNLTEIEARLHDDYGSFVAEWSPELSSLSAKLKGEAAYPVIETAWMIERQSTFYLLKFLVPAFMIYLIACVSFTLTDVGRATGMSGVILFATFSLFMASSSSVAKVGYLTLFDLVLVVQMILVLVQLILIFAWGEEVKLGPMAISDRKLRIKTAFAFVIGYALFYWIAYQSYVG